MMHGVSVVRMVLPTAHLMALRVRSLCAGGIAKPMSVQTLEFQVPAACRVGWVGWMVRYACPMCLLVRGLVIQSHHCGCICSRACARGAGICDAAMAVLVLRVC